MLRPLHRLALIALALLALPLAARAQGFLATTTKDGTDVWAAGAGGRLWRSLNQGAAWSPGQFGTVPLRGVAHRALTVLVVGDSGQVYRSTNNGGSFALQTAPGLPALRAVVIPSATRAYVAGDAGTILRSDDGGASWNAQSSGTGATLNALAFTDADHGWAAGAGGTLLQTADGGATWAPVASGTANELFAVAQSGTNVWVGGADGTCLLSTTGGATFAPYNLRADYRPDVRAIAMASPTDVWIAGGGGFIRWSQDGGGTWLFPESPVHGQVSALALGGGNLIAVSSRFLAPVRWNSFSGVFSLPTGATLTRSWVSRLSSGTATVRGNSIAVNPWNKHVIYALLGTSLSRSPDDGETWTLARTLAGVNRANGFVISAKDTAVMVAAVVTTGGSHEVWRSANAGATWTIVYTPANGWGEYGIPLEIHPDKPDTLLIGVDNSPLYRSINGGLTWSPFGAQVFRSPCDIIITPDKEQVLLVGDGITGSGIGDLWQSTDGGATFSQRQLANGSEIPGLSMGRLNNSVAFATTWSSAGVRFTTDGGKSWPLVTDLNRAGQSVTSSWGTAVCHEDPNLAIVGVYSGGLSYLSTNGGGTFSTAALSGTNYSFDIRDRETVLAQQASGVFKMRFAYAYTPAAGVQSLALNAPNGGETWNAGTVHTVTWSAANVALARIEWRAGPADPWHLVAEVPGYLGTFAWTVPDVATTTAEVRVSDAWDASPSDVTNAVFTILQPSSVTLLSPAGGEAWKVGTTHPLTWAATGVDSVVLEYRTAPAAAWTQITRVLSSPAAYDWLVPLAPSATARVRVHDRLGSLESITPADFAITVPYWNLASQELDMGYIDLSLGAYATFSVRDTGTAAMAVTGVASDNPRFTVFRTAFTVAAGGQDSLGVFFAPLTTGADSATITVTADDPDSPHLLKVRADATTALGVEPGSPGLPRAFALAPPAPNPFHASANATVRFEVPSRARVSLEVFDLQGHRVATLANGEMEPGRYSLSFGSGSVLAGGEHVGRLRAGVYFLRMRAARFTATRRMLVIS
jgi:photosystem II stability/assembly factor-like uncharacterized protein